MLARDIPIFSENRWDQFCARLDWPLIGIVACIMTLGLVMVASASMPLAERATGQPFHYFQHQLGYAFMGVLAAMVALKIPMKIWQDNGFLVMSMALLLLLVVLIPGVGYEKNGSSRWLDLPLFRVQISELTRLMLMVYLSGYLVRRSEELRERIRGTLKPVLVLSIACLLLLMEPDFGAAAVLMLTALTMIYIAGARLLPFSAMFAAIMAALWMLAWMAPYRVRRLTSFLDPWNDPQNTGYQLTNSLVAIGSGQWFGVGLGESIQKMHYLPEAHTDFIFAILAEELGLMGTLLVLVLFMALIGRIFMIAGRAAAGKRWFSVYLASGIGAWFGIQAFINLGVNMGVLPTKGLTLPLISYGGSSLVVVSFMVGMLLRVEMENRDPSGSPASARAVR